MSHLLCHICKQMLRWPVLHAHKVNITDVKRRHLPKDPWTWMNSTYDGSPLRGQFLVGVLKECHTLSEETAHPTVYHHLSQLSFDIQWNGLIKCSEDSGLLMQLTHVIFCSLTRYHMSQLQ